METVTSADGTSIAYERRGEGTPLILLHGGSGTRASLEPLATRLTDEFTVVVPDRRGRGDSGDGDEYSLDREVEDLRALVDTVDGEPAVFGHSFGGLVAVAAMPDLAVQRLVLYEPAILVGEHRDDDLTDRMQARLDNGERLEALRLFIEESGEVQDVEQFPWWPDEAPVHLVETVIRENRAVEAFRLPDEPDVPVPTLLVTGERGPTHLRDAVFALQDRLPESELVELDGVGHVATESAPDRVAAAVRPFVRES